MRAVGQDTTLTHLRWAEPFSWGYQMHVHRLQLLTVRSSSRCLVFVKNQLLSIMIVFKFHN